MKLCTLHTTDKFMEMMSDPFTKPFLKDNPEETKRIEEYAQVKNLEKFFE